MTDTVIGRVESKQAEQPVDKPMSKPSGDSVSEIKIEPPFTDYEKAHSLPFVVENYDLGKFWNKDETYTKEVKTIEGYLRAKVRSGEIANDLDAVKKTLRGVEKTAGVTDTDRTVVKVGKLAAYLRFLSEVDHITHDK